MMGTVNDKILQNTVCDGILNSKVLKWHANQDI